MKILFFVVEVKCWTPPFAGCFWHFLFISKKLKVHLDSKSKNIFEELHGKTVKVWVSWTTKMFDFTSIWNHYVKLVVLLFGYLLILIKYDFAFYYFILLYNYDSRKKKASSKSKNWMESKVFSISIMCS